MIFAREIWLWFVPLLPLLWLLFRAGDRRARSRMIVLLGDRAAGHVERANPRLATWRRFFFFAGLFWLLLALARPQWGASEVSVTQRGSDIVVALDISNSMLTEDVPPNRMERAKVELGSFLDRLQDSRVGLVFFAGSAFIQCPLTLDYGTADIFLGMAGPDMLSEQGTALAAALKTGRELLAKGSEGDPRGNFQAILLVTDGEDFEGNWEEEARACLDAGIKVIPVGVGEDSGGLIPILDEKGRPAGFMKDEEGNVVLSRLDMASLESLAAMGNGSPFRIGVDGLAGDRLFAELQRLGKRDLEERRVSAYQERYLYPLILAMLCIALRFLLSPRRKLAALVPAAVHTGKVALLALLLAGIGGGSAQAGVRPSGSAEMEAGLTKYRSGDYQGALMDFESALVRSPEDPLITLAVGETLHQLQDYEKAVGEFTRVLELTEDPGLRAEALYNAGTSLLAAGDPKTAADLLRGSLTLDPDQEDALYNLEAALKLQQLQEQQQQQQEDQQQEQDPDQQPQEGDEQEDQQPPQDQPQEENQDSPEEQQQDPQQQEQQEQQQAPPQEQQPQPEETEEQEEPTPEELTRQQALQILQALDRDEEELKRSVQKRLKGGKAKSGKKW